MSLLKNKLNIPLTIEATLQGTNGYLLGKIRDEQGIPTRLDVRSLDEELPGSVLGLIGAYSKKYYNEMNQSSPTQIDLKKQPVYVSIRRPEQAVMMFKDESMLNGHWVNTYFLWISNYGKSYFTSICSNGLVQERGDKTVLEEIQRDPEFSKYISFIPQQSDYSGGIQFKKWDLNKVFKGRSRD